MCMAHGEVIHVHFLSTDGNEVVRIKRPRFVERMKGGGEDFHLCAVFHEINSAFQPDVVGSPILISIKFKVNVILIPDCLRYCIFSDKFRVNELLAAVYES